MERRIDAAVVGAGVMGLAGARALASAGRSVVCFEQFRLGHSQGSSHGSSRIFRLAYEDPDFTRLAQKALPLWHELQAESGAELLRRTGSLDVGGDLEGFRAALTGNGIDAQMLRGDDLRRRFPRLRLPNDEALFHAEGGVVHADRAVRAFAQSVRARGGEIAEESRVLELHEDEGGVRVDTQEGSILARAAVVAAGPWVRDLVATLPVSVTRETVIHLRLPANGLPTLIDHSEPEVPVPLSHQATYALPSLGIGLKVGIHRSGAPADPAKHGQPDRQIVDAAVNWARSRYDLVELTPAFIETCLYTSTEDQGFLVERQGRIVICSACSGHGFKFAPALGQHLAELVEEALAD